MENNTPFFIVLGLVIGLGIIVGLYFSTDQGMSGDVLNDSDISESDEVSLGESKDQISPVTSDDNKAEEPKIETLNSSDNLNNNMSPEEKIKVQKPEVTIDKTKKYSAVMKTSEGDIKLEFNASGTPITVNNFVYLAKLGFYNDVIFHRVIDGFMIQSGDPLGNGTGGPDYRFEDEEFTGEYTRGTIAMANAGPDTNGSQFFIMHKDYNLPKNYVIFGKVTEGLDVVDKIATSKVKMGVSGENSTPENPVKILNIDIIEE